jgi:Ni,Fe-hydrogenase III large subunit
MPALNELIEMGRPVDAHRPWPRAVVDAAAWRRAADELRNGRLTLLGLWGDRGAVHMALSAEGAGIAIMSLDCPAGHFPSVGAVHSPAIRPERTIRDLFGLEPEGAADTRPWLDHGHWELTRPLDEKPQMRSPVDAPYLFLPAEGESLHQIAVGPVHAGIIEPGHFRFTAGGETIVRLEERLGYVHKGIEKLMEGAELDHAAKLAGRTSGDSTVAYAIAFARAAEAALAIDVPPRAHWLRALMAELERLANHFGDIGAICNDASFALMQAHCAVLRERVLRAADAAFGHRLMRDCVVPGGVGAELERDGVAAIGALVVEARHRFPPLIALYDNTASLLQRTVGTGVLSPELALRFGAGGYVGRASGRAFDARRSPGYTPYDQLKFDVPVREEGDVNARVWIRIREIEQSLELIGQILDRLPAGPIRADWPRIDRREPAEGVALVEGFRGDILVWMRLGGDGRVERCHLRDPSWFHWPLLEAAIEGNIVADFPLCNKSFNCSYSGHDL